MSMPSLSHQTSISLIQPISISAPTPQIIHSTPLQPIGHREHHRQTIVDTRPIIVGVGKSGSLVLQQMHLPHNDKNDNN